VGVALLTGLGYLAVVYYPREGLLDLQQGILVPVEQKLSKTEMLEQRLDVLEKRAAETAGGAASLNNAGDKPQAGNKGASSNQATRDFIAAAFSFWDLREAAKTGRSFTLQLAALRATSGGDAKLSELAAKLEPYAAGTTPTLAHLREKLSAEEKAAPAPVVENEAPSLKSRVKSALEPLISVRPLHDARFADLEKALDAGDAAAALEAVKALPEEARKNIGAWQAELEARKTLDDTLQTLTVYFTTSSPERSAP
jgi:hypothetical protein